MIRSSKLILIIATLQFALRPCCAADELVTVNAESVVSYIRSCRKINGAFGPADQEYTDVAWNYPAVHALRLLKVGIPDADKVLSHGLAYPTGHAGYGHWLVYHQTLTRRLLEKDLPSSADLYPSDASPRPVQLTHQGFDVLYYGSPFGTGGDLHFKASGDSTAQRFRASTELGYYNLSSLYYLLAAIIADGRAVSNPDALVRFIVSRQAKNGGFVDIRTEDGRPSDSETHIAHTYHAVLSLKLLGAAIPNAKQCVDFVRKCQVIRLPPNLDSAFGTGGFLFDPDITRPGNYPDVYYTLAGLQALSVLNAKPASVERGLQWLVSLQNYDGGFGDRPGWRSRLYSTYYAVHSLALLAKMSETRGAQLRESLEPESSSSDLHDQISVLTGSQCFGLPKNVVPTRKLPVPRNRATFDDSLRIYQGLFKTPVVMTGDLPGLADRGFNLIAMKTDDFGAANTILNPRNIGRRRLDVILCPEAYSHRLRRHGGAVLHHVGNFTLDPRWSEQQRDIWNNADAAGKEALQWPAYQRHVLRPLQKLGSLCYPEQDFELEYAYSAYDDGLYGRDGYNAVQVGFNWSPRDFVRVFPWRERYVDKLPPVADADAHGDLAKWSPQLDHTRHLYIGKNASYSAFQDAARNGRVVCVVVGVENVASQVSFYGPTAAVNFVKGRINEWKWW